MKKRLYTFVGIFMIFTCFALTNIIMAQDDKSVGIDTKQECLMWMWKDCFEYEKMLWIKEYQSGSGATATSISQDIVVAATYMVGTVLTIVLIFCWLMYIFAARNWKDPGKYKDWLINAWIWAVLVWWAYAIVRLIQYIAKW